MSEGLPHSARAGRLMVLLALLLAGCGDRYNAEKEHWQVCSRHAGTMQDPAKAGAADFRAAVGDLRKLIARHPNGKRAAEIQYMIGTMYAARGRYDTAREEMRRVLTTWPERYELCARAQFMIGYCHEQVNEVPAALREYRRIAEAYPDTSTGMQAPLYIAGYCKRRGMFRESRAEYDRAIREYRDRLVDVPDRKDAPLIEDCLIAACGAEGNWEKAIEALRSVVSRDPAGKQAPATLLRIARLCEEKLHRDDEAREAYRRVVDLCEARGRERNAECAAQARMGLAVQFERAGRWNDALREYRELIRRHPRTMQGLQVPLLIARHYQECRQNDEAQKAFSQAVEDYGALARRYRDRRIAVVAREMIALSWIMRNDWDRALASLNDLQKEYPKQPEVVGEFARLTGLFRDRARDLPGEAELYNRYIERYPDHRLREGAFSKARGGLPESPR